MPPRAVYWAALAIRRVFGRLPFAPAIKGNVSDDPRVEADQIGESYYTLLSFPLHLSSNYPNITTTLFYVPNLHQPTRCVITETSESQQDSHCSEVSVPSSPPPQC